MRKLLLALAAVGAIGVAASATPASAAPAMGLTKPQVESNAVDVRCWHRRHRSSWRCHQPHYYAAPLYQPYYQPFYYSQPRWHHHHHRRHHHHHRHR